LCLIATPQKGGDLFRWAGESLKFCGSGAMQDRRAGYFHRSAPRLATCGQSAISFGKRATKPGLPKELVLYCARHDYGTRVLMRTGNLAAVMRTMGHRDVKTAMHYQHPELETVRAALDYRPPTTEAAA